MQGRTAVFAMLTALAALPPLTQAQSQSQAQAGFDMRSVTEAVDALRQLRSSVDRASTQLGDVLFVSQEVRGRCYSQCRPSPQGRQICSGDKGDYSFRFDVSDLRPKFNVPISQQKMAATVYSVQLRQNLEAWAEAVKHTTADLNEAEAGARRLRDGQGNSDFRAQHELIRRAMNRAERDLTQVAKGVAVIREGMAGYLVRQSRPRKELEDARGALDQRLSSLNGQIQQEISRRACADGPTAQYASFQQTAVAHVNSISRVYDDVHARAQAAQQAGAGLLGETTFMTDQIRLVEDELNNAKNAIEVDQALATFHGGIAMKAWNAYAAHVAEAVAK